MKASELRNLSREELRDKAVALKKELFQMRNQGSSGRIEKPGRIKIMRREIARILTLLREKEK